MSYCKHYISQQKIAFKFNLFLVRYGYRPGYLSDPKCDVFIGQYGLNKVKNYIFSNETYEKYGDLIEKYKTHDINDDDFTILLGYPSFMVPENTKKYGYSLYFKENNKIFTNTKYELFSFVSFDRIDKKPLYDKFEEAATTYNTINKTNYSFYIDESIYLEDGNWYSFK